MTGWPTGINHRLMPSWFWRVRAARIRRQQLSVEQIRNLWGVDDSQFDEWFEVTET